MPARATSLGELLAERIRNRGPITFAEYMEACLYHPQYGYYSKPDQRARRDYFTSVDVAPLFGRLLTRQLEEMWHRLDRPSPFTLVEAGAGNGALAKDILDFAAASLPEFYSALHYLAVERSDARRRALHELLGRYIARGTCVSAADIPQLAGFACLFSNELLDALPVHRVIQRGGKLLEIYVAAEAGRLCETLGPPSSPRIPEYLAEQGITLRDEQHAEAALSACGWIEDAGKRLPRGFVLTMDYGREARELYDERHMRGTLLAYNRHHQSEDFFSAPGDQDLTAHVNFTALDLWGRRSGMLRTGLATQTNFLLNLARKSNFEDIEIPGTTEREKIRGRLLFKTLIYPEGMGETFQVFVQHKGIQAPHLTGLQQL